MNVPDACVKDGREEGTEEGQERDFRDSIPILKPVPFLFLQPLRCVP